MRFRSAGASAQPARSMSVLWQRASAAMTGPRTCVDTVRTASASASDAIGNPASSTSAPSFAIWRASFSFSSMRIEKPGACSPSRSVVSKMVRLRPAMWGPPGSSCTVRRPIRPVYNRLFYITLSYDASMQLQDLTVFATVAAERSFSRAAKRLHRTQPAVSQAIRRLEEELGDRLFDRSSRDGTLTEAGRLLQDYAARLLTLASDAELAVRELQEVRRGRVVIGANEAAVHSLLPAISTFGAAHPQVLIDVRRLPSRHIPAALLDRSIDFGVLTFAPPERALQAISLGHDELVMLAHPRHPLAARK